MKKNTSRKYINQTYICILIVCLFTSITNAAVIECTGEAQIVRLHHDKSKVIILFKPQNGNASYLTVCELDPVGADENQIINNELCHVYFDMLTTAIITDKNIGLGLDNQISEVFTTGQGTDGSCETITHSNIETALKRVTIINN